MLTLCSCSFCCFSDYDLSDSVFPVTPKSLILATRPIFIAPVWWSWVNFAWSTFPFVPCCSLFHLCLFWKNDERHHSPTIFVRCSAIAQSSVAFIPIHSYGDQSEISGISGGFMKTIYQRGGGGDSGQRTNDRNETCLWYSYVELLALCDRR